MNTLTLLKTSVVATGIASCLALGVMAANDPESPVDVNRSATAQADKPASRAAVPQVETDEASPLAGTAAQPAEPASDNDSPKEPEPTRSGKKKSRQGARNKGNSDSKSPRVSGNRNQASTPSTEPRPRAATPNDGSKSGGFATSGGTSSARGSSMSASGGRSGGGGSSSSMARSGGGTGGATSAGGTGGKSFKGTTNRNGRQFQTNDSLQVPDFEAIFQQMQREASEASGLPFPVGAESSSFHGTLTINGETMEFDSAEEYEAARRKHGLHLPTLPQ